MKKCSHYCHTGPSTSRTRESHDRLDHDFQVAISVLREIKWTLNSDKSEDYCSAKRGRVIIETITVWTREAITDLITSDYDFQATRFPSLKK